MKIRRRLICVSSVNIRYISGNILNGWLIVSYELTIIPSLFPLTPRNLATTTDIQSSMETRQRRSIIPKLRALPANALDHIILDKERNFCWWFFTIINHYICQFIFDFAAYGSSQISCPMLATECLFDQKTE